MNNRPELGIAFLDDRDWEVLKAATGQLETALQQSLFPELAPLVPPLTHPLRARLLVELIKVDQEYRWKAGQRKQMEAYLEEWPELRDRPECVTELLEAECLSRALLEEMPSVEELRGRFGSAAESINWEAIRAEAGEERTRTRSPKFSAEIGTASLAGGVTPASGPSDSPLTAEQTFGRYEIRSPLGEGGMGWVYRAYDTHLERDVALKIPRFDPTADSTVLRRFIQEAKTAARIEHPNICPVFDAGEVEGVYYLTMALIEGRSLSEWLKDRTHSAREAAELVRKLARALDTVHAAGIVHRDIKPSNVMIDLSGEPRLMDFGLARLTPTDPPDANAASRIGIHSSANAVVPPDNHEHTSQRHSISQNGLRSGTLPYMSREQLEGQPADARSDVYGLGVLLFQILTGRLPYGDSPQAILAGIYQSEPPPLHSLRPDLDSQLESICLKALAKDSADRYQSAAEMAQALQAYSQPLPQPGSPPSRRSKAWLLTMAGAAALFLAGTIIYVQTNKGTAKITVLPPDAKVTIDGETIHIKSPRDEITVRVGEHLLEVSKDDFITQTTSFSIRRGGQEELSVTLVGRPQHDSDVPKALELPKLQVTRWIETIPSMNGLCVSQDGLTLYAACWENRNQSRIQVFDIPTGELKHTLAFGDYHTHGDVVLSADERYLFTSNYYQDYVSRIDLQQNNARKDLRVGGRWANDIDITPDRHTLVIPLGADGRPADEHNDRVAIVDIADGQFTLTGKRDLPDEPLEHKIGFSPDSKFAYMNARNSESSKQCLYEIQLTLPCRVTRMLAFPGGDLRGIAVSPEGDRIYVSDTGQKKIRVVDRKTFKEIADFAVQGHTPETIALSPAGNLLAIACPNTKTLFLVDPVEEKPLAQVVGLRNSAKDVEFSSDGGTVFVAQEEPRGGIAVIDVHLLAYDIVFASNRAGESYQVYLMTAAEREPLRLTTNHASDRYPCWSPDGQSIAFVSDREGTPRIFVMDRSGSVTHSLEKTDPLVSSPSQETSLDWSPDGAEIAFIGVNKKAVKIVNVASGEVRTVIDGAIPPDYAWLRGLSWRKSDGKILINGQHPASVFQQDIFLLDPKTRDIQQITKSQGGPAHWSAPAASRDGQKLAALRVSNSGPPLSQIFLLNADGTLPTPLCKDLRALMNNLRWSPDGRYLVYSETTNNVSHIQIVGIKDEKPLCLTTGAGEDIEPDIFGRSPPQSRGNK